MRHIFHGAGAVGSLVGGLLAEQGAEVVLIARAAHAEAINTRGLTIRNKQGDRCIQGITAVTSPQDIEPREDDVLFLTVKSGQTAESVQLLREVFSEPTPIFCLQNGVRNEEMAARRFLHVYGAMAGVSASLLEPGLISDTLDHKIAIGNYPLGCDELAREVAAALSRTGLKVTTHENVMAVKWSKLIINLDNAALAITDNYVQLGRVTPRISRFLAEVEAEGLSVLEVAGISVEEAGNPYNFTTRHAQMRNLTEDGEAIERAKNLPRDLRTYPSTWVDLKQKRGETEAGYFNGEIVLLGERNGVSTPYNSTLLRLVERMAAERLEPGLCTIDELADLVEQRRRELYQG